MKHVYLKMKKWIALLPLLLCLNMAMAQSIKVAGTVTDVKGEPMPGVTILVEGTTNGTTTDIAGKYAIEVPSSGNLVFNFVGYISQTISVKGKSAISITMEEDLVELSEVVVVGYGTQKKSDLTGAVASVGVEELSNAVTTNIDQALQGRIAGVQVTQNSGQPGGVASIRIRGANSITGSSEPLYVIDGIPFQGDAVSTAGFDWAGGANGQNQVNPLSTINPNDIVSMEVLKDASATAIYGARAANGVVLITTKRGQEGEAKISYNAYYGVQELPRTIEMMNLKEFADYQLTVAQDINQIPDQRYLDPSLLGEGTNWQQAIFREAAMQSHQVSVTGGTKNTKYALTGGYFGQDGIVIGSNFERFTTRISLDNNLKKWLKVGGTISFARTDEEITLNSGGDGVIMQALLTTPATPVKDINGEYAGPEQVNTGVSYNPVAAALIRDNTMKRERLFGNFYAEATLMKGLTFRTEYGMDNNASLNKAFHPTYTWGALVNKENMLRQREEGNFFWIWKNYVTYNTKINDHSLTAMLGQEAQKSAWEGSEVTKRNFASNDIQVLSQGEQDGTVTNGWKDGASLASYFGRFNYGFKDKYLATFTLRADGSSKFGPENKWGYFPSGSIAWRVKNEPFMQSLDAVEDLKLRLGYGEVGNQAIGNYLYGSAMVTLNTPFGTAYRMNNIANPSLKWESTVQYNLGVDLSLFSGRATLTVDLYDKQTKDMLLQLSVPSYLGGTGWDDISAPYGNVGSLQNRGIEVALATVNYDKNDFTWSSNFNISVNRNEVLDLADNSKPYFKNLYWYSEFQTATMTKVGQPIGVFYGYVTEGLFKDREDIINHAVQVKQDGSETDEKPNGVNLVDKTSGVWVGDVKFKDLNGDGIINTDDQTIIGNPNPDFTFGFNNNFRYKGFDLSIFLSGAYGGDILNYSRVMIEGQTSLYNNQSAEVNNRARYQYSDPSAAHDDQYAVSLANPETTIPRFTTNDVNRNNRMSDRFIEDGSYLRIQNVKLAYTFPAAMTRRFMVQKLRLYSSIQNLYTFTNYSGYDPEIGAFNQNPLMQNVDMGRYPTPRVYTLGIDVEF
ncbi:TonB-dependent receptor [Limibacter armeniacum]|uniref:SusC/RagA family TonB-linked outer membrane protein n=1 Tax=Limibacter armeniacum TaxID=466084 RepID=UPI002FE65E38